MSERTYGGLEMEEVEAIAASIFCADDLIPGDDGCTLIGRTGECIAYNLVGWNGQSWDVRSAAGSESTIEAAGAYCPYDLKKLCWVLSGRPLPVGTHEDPQEQANRIQSAIDAWRTES